MSETSSGTVTGRALSREMARSLSAIRREHDRLARRGRDLPPGADWLLDNWYLIEREGKLAASELRGAGRLRASGGSAVIVSACAALVRESGGAVTAVVCHKQVKSLTISPEVVDPDDVEMLTDLVMAAVNEALTQCEETTTREMQRLTGGMQGLPF